MVRRRMPGAKGGPFLDGPGAGVDAGNPVTQARPAIRLAARAAALCLVLWTGCVPAARAELWVAFGDSLMATEKWGWVDLLGQETGNTVLRAAQGGRTTQDALSVLETEVVAKKPDLVFVGFGINDQRIPNGGTPGAYEVPPESFSRNLDTIITRIQETGARVVLLTCRPLVEGPAGADGPPKGFYLDRNGDGGTLYTLPRKTKDSIRLYNDIIRAKAREHGTFLVDIWQAVVAKAGSDGDADVLRLDIDRPLPLLDGVHPGPGGARLYADAVEAAMPFRRGGYSGGPGAR
jgi:lysophospholipase L1-like esterase